MHLYVFNAPAADMRINFNILNGGGEVVDTFGGGRLAHEYGGESAEFVCFFCGEQFERALARYPLVHLGVAAQIVKQRIGYDVALNQYFDVRGYELTYFIVKQGVMCATQYYGVDLGIGVEQ